MRKTNRRIKKPQELGFIEKGGPIKWAVFKWGVVLLCFVLATLLVDWVLCTSNIDIIVSAVCTQAESGKAESAIEIEKIVRELVKRCIRKVLDQNRGDSAVTEQEDFDFKRSVIYVSSYLELATLEESFKGIDEGVRPIVKYVEPEQGFYDV